MPSGNGTENTIVGVPSAGRKVNPIGVKAIKLEKKFLFVEIVTEELVISIFLRT